MDEHIQNVLAVSVCIFCISIFFFSVDQKKCSLPLFLNSFLGCIFHVHEKNWWHGYFNTKPSLVTLFFALQRQVLLLPCTYHCLQLCIPFCLWWVRALHFLYIWITVQWLEHASSEMSCYDVDFRKRGCPFVCCMHRPTLMLACNIHTVHTYMRPCMREEFFRHGEYEKTLVQRMLTRMHILFLWKKPVFFLCWARIVVLMFACEGLAMSEMGIQCPQRSPSERVRGALQVRPSKLWCNVLLCLRLGIMSLSSVRFSLFSFQHWLPPVLWRMSLTSCWEHTKWSK